MRLWSVILLLQLNGTACSERFKRQLSLDDIINRALSLVRPIFDTSQPLQNDEMLRKHSSPTAEDRKDSSILGSHFRSPLDDLPICKGDSKICRFISCSAENFKKDPTFANIQLAAQVLGDSQLRHAVSSNPEAIDAVCTEQGMSEAQCKLFSKGFQIIDKVITNFEKPSNGLAKVSVAEKEIQVPQSDPIPVPIKKDNNIPQDDDADYYSPPVRPKTMGSRTWSSLPEASEPQLLDARNDLVASWTPPPLLGLSPLTPFPPFTPPTIPTAPPLAFPTVPSIIMPSLKIPELGTSLVFDKSLMALKIEPPIRLRRAAEDEHIRVERDYYDDLSSGGTNGGQLGQTPAEKAVDDYYGQIEETRPEPTVKPSPLRDCVNMLG